ncbi:MAG: response regulator [Magnetococcales bacterium]|nr:response regulator [Magnetococcales bacterium]
MVSMLSKPRILIVDDQKTNIDILVAILSDYDRRICLSGKQALKVLEADPVPDLILLDIMMPEMDGYEVCKQIKADERTQNIPIIFVTAKKEASDEKKGFDLGAVDYVTKPFNPDIIIRRVQTQLELKQQRDHLEEIVQERTLQLSEKVVALEKTEDALRDAMQNLLVSEVTPGVFWIQVPEAELYILCGCPSEVVKHLMRKGFINTVTKNGVTCESGPNVILLSEVLVQNGDFANLSEFPVLQMLFRQGMIIPGHPNNTGIKPMIIGSSAQVKAQMEYIYRGKHGLVSLEEILACGVDEATAENMMKVKLKFAFGELKSPTNLLDTLEVGAEPVEIRNGVTVCNVGLNRYKFFYRDLSTEVDMNLPGNVQYEAPYPLGSHHFKRHFFSILHTGEGDGWDVNRRSMSSIIIYQGRIFLIDAGPQILQAMTALGINIAEVEGVFHTHGHDDHFAGLPVLIHSDHRLKYFATPEVRSAVAKKFTALMSMEEEKFGQFFEICDLTVDTWNDCLGLEVMPIYSPHPTDTNILIFRAREQDRYKSYAHWSDLSSFSVLDKMVGEGPDDLSAAFMNKVKKDYLLPVNLKKLDVGGGMIHGVASDFIDDQSECLILSHYENKLSSQEMAIGSETSFGAMDVLIPGDLDYLRQRAAAFLQIFFNGVPANQIELLIDCPIIEYNAGTILYRSKEDNKSHIDMILTGTVTYLDPASDVHNNLSFGSFIGSDGVFSKDKVLTGVFRTYSHCSVLRFATPTFLEFLERNKLQAHMAEIQDKTWFLRQTWLFGEQTTFLSLGTIAKTIEKFSAAAGEEITIGIEPRVWLVVTGKVKMFNAKGQLLETLEAGDFFGEHTYFTGLASPWRFKCEQHVDLYCLNLVNLFDIPIVHWKMLEVFEKRKKFVATKM